MTNLVSQDEDTVVITRETSVVVTRQGAATVVIKRQDPGFVVITKRESESVSAQPEPVIVKPQVMTPIVISPPPSTVVVSDVKPKTVVVTRGIPGPEGRQGPPGPAGGATLIEVGPAPIGGHSAVACNAGGLLVPADSTVYAHLGAVVGLVQNAYVPGDLAEVKAGYPLEHAGWTWTPGPVYVGAAGQLTQTLPLGAIFVQVIGFALSATRVLIDLQPPS
ncbi:hypothetical protein [Ottowia sp. VDI28]|uniref:hypothetical protein n=1 Tax=Ottowia sp. VDI28 TaxID=3133968 RepID=UPI003C2F8A8C